MAIRIFLSGCFGRMGRMIADIVSGSGDISIVAGFDAADGSAAFPVYKDLRLCREEFDVLLDFSNTSALPSVFELIRERRCPSVICTTGLDEDLQKQLVELSKTSAVFQTANLSLGINLMIRLATKAARLLYPEFDIEILEAHHNQKVDAPSGTALMIARALNDTLGGQMEFVCDRSKVRKKREHREIGIQAIRGGSIVGEHTVFFAGQDEVFSMHHSAQSRAVFARGALAAVRFMANKQPGLYSMSDLLDF
jgi:4-hydroxy-tetrahydrodipicolinate reductase